MLIRFLIICVGSIGNWVGHCTSYEYTLALLIDPQLQRSLCSLMSVSVAHTFNHHYLEFNDQEIN